ncbi:MAG: flagellar basal body rod protein FlgB [Clostridium sp.]|uniref:flagellar basal body rod protein FlgB n=1 Tax=Clostridium TaxID=1485 RepID=UPI002153319F|nr:flagellar basal body rod protein FlgB [Clostridium sp. LY3-2]MCR6513565.1 flagellar basal body rod protein FlgB [Clostridium sp. LY3-2]
MRIGSTYDLIKEGLDAASVRSKAIANNIANINTKDYKRDVVSFEENLKNETMKLSLKKTNPKHFGDSNSEGNITVSKDMTTSMRSDGNNVDLDIEKTNQAANQLKYNALVEMASGKLNNLNLVIRGGR